jgi:hypothetical protein
LASLQTIFDNPSQSPKILALAGDLNLFTQLVLKIKQYSILF